jgi:hypothetical protein
MKKIEDERWDEKERLMVGVTKSEDVKEELKDDDGGGKIIKNTEGAWVEGVRIK